MCAPRQIYETNLCKESFLAQISVSLNVVNTIDRTVTLPGDTTLAQVRAGFENRVPLLDDALFVVSYRISQTDSPLYELGVRTGDIFTLTTSDAPVGDGLGVNLLRPGVDVLEVSDNATASDILRGLSKLIQKPAHQLYIGRYAANLDHTLDEFGLTNGDLVSLALLPTRVDYELLLVPARGGYTPIHVRDESAVMGGPDETIDICISCRAASAISSRGRRRNSRESTMCGMCRRCPLPTRPYSWTATGCSRSDQKPYLRTM